MLKYNHRTYLRGLWENKLNTKIPKQEIISNFDSVIKHADVLSPYMKIPNAGNFQVTELHDYHPILSKELIKKRMKPASIEIKELSSELRYMNNYIDKMFRNLNKNRSNPRQFWNIARTLLFYSISFRISCLIKVYPTWYKTEKLIFVQKILKNYNKLDFSAFNYKQLIIPKANGKLRSLGIPKPAWRLFQTGLNMILLV